MLDQENSLNSSRSETTARILTPAGPGQTLQLVTLPCQPSHGIAMAYGADGHRQPRLTKAILDQHEKAALTSLLLMQSTAMKASPGPHTPPPGLQQVQTSQPSCETSDTCSETGSSSHPPPRRSARRCKRKLQSMMTPCTEHTGAPSQPAPVYQPVARQQEFPLSRQTACAMVHSMLQRSSERKRAAPDLVAGRCAGPVGFARCPSLPIPGACDPNWNVQVWPAPPNCAMG